jgi:hypothetical protein
MNWKEALEKEAIKYADEQYQVNRWGREWVHAREDFKAGAEFILGREAHLSKQKQFFDDMAEDWHLWDEEEKGTYPVKRIFDAYEKLLEELPQAKEDSQQILGYEEYVEKIDNLMEHYEGQVLSNAIVSEIIEPLSKSTQQWWKALQSKHEDLRKVVKELKELKAKESDLVVNETFESAMKNLDEEFGIDRQDANTHPEVYEEYRARQNQIGEKYNAAKNKGGELLQSDAVEFAKWYSGMDEEKIKRAYARWLSESDVAQQRSNEFEN